MIQFRYSHYNLISINRSYRMAFRILHRRLSGQANIIQKEFARIDISGVWPPIPTPFLPAAEYALIILDH